MTFFADRNNIKPVFFFVTVPVVVLFGWMITIMAFEVFSFWYFPISDSVADSTACLVALRKTATVFFISTAVYYFTFRTFIIIFACCFAFFAFPIQYFVRFSTRCALRTKPVFSISVFAKFRNKFDLFAMATSLCYDLLSHNCLLYRRLRLESVSRPILVSGSFYYSNEQLQIKTNFKKFRRT